MKIITNGIKERYIIYKLYDNIQGKVYIGKTTIPIYMRINSHRHGNLEADKYFSAIGWENVTFEIIDWSYCKNELLEKERTQIGKQCFFNRDKLLNINNLFESYFSAFPVELRTLAQNYFEA